MNDSLLIVLGFVLFGWGVTEFFLDKAYVRTHERWVFEWIKKKDHPVRYWLSIAIKCGAGTFVILSWISHLIHS